VERWLNCKDLTLSAVSKTSPKASASSSSTKTDLRSESDAETGTWENNVWKLKSIQVYDLSTGKISRIPEMAYTEIESPKIFSEDAIKVEEMALIELIRYKNRLAEAGIQKCETLGRPRFAFIVSHRKPFHAAPRISLSVGGEQKGIEKVFRIKTQETHSNAGVVSAGLACLSACSIGSDIHSLFPWGTQVPSRPS